MTNATLTRSRLPEFLAIFAAVPALLFVIKPHGILYAALWIAALLACRTLGRQYGWSLRRDWNAGALTRASAIAILKRFVPFAAALLAFTWLMVPDHLFSLPLERPGVWLMVMVLYPLLSVIPQEIIFRSFFFRRYGAWLGMPLMMAASALAFGWVHIVMRNWIAVVFSAIGGVLFANTYQKTQSLAAVCFEHALYGCYVFTIGLGVFFYHGQAIR